MRIMLILIFIQYVISLNADETTSIIKNVIKKYKAIN